MSKPCILITGGAGYIGSRLARRLVAGRKASVTVIDNLRRGSVESLSPIRDSIRFFEGDVRDGDALQELTRGVETTFHFAAESAAMSADADPEYCFETNLTGTFRVLTTARRNGVKRVVFSSSREVYGDPATIPVLETAPLHPRTYTARVKRRRRCAAGRSAPANSILQSCGFRTSTVPVIRAE
jgi:UDP-glucose 4-epimerase